MYLYKVEIKKSEIEGKGVFVMEKISKGSVAWKFDPKHDLSISQEEFKKLDREEKRKLKKIGYISPVSKKWIYPPEDDPAFFTNHSSSINNLSAVFNPEVSPEPFFKANRDVLVGEELIVNYLEFDEFIKKTKPNWT